MDIKNEAKRARHDILGWKNLLFGWNTYASLGREASRGKGNLKELFRHLPFARKGPPVLPETFDQATKRLHLSNDRLDHLASSLRLRAAWWALAMSFAFVSLALAPLSRHAIAHGTVAAAVVFFCATRALSWYFRACQVRDRNLYTLRSWWNGNRTLKRALTTLVAIVLLALLITSGVAHAAVPIEGFAPDPRDPSVSALRQVFGAMVDTVLGEGDAHKDAMDSSLGAMMVPFNAAVLFFTIIFAGYATLRAIADTAQSGQFMGRKADVSGYIAMRIFLGVGLLVPLGSGYSLIQYGMMWWSLQGAGLGNQVNSAALSYMGDNKESMIAEPKVPSATSFVRNVLKARVCMAAMNQQYVAEQDDTRIVMKTSTLKLAPESQSWWQRIKGQSSFNMATEAQWTSGHPILQFVPVVQFGRFFSNIGEYNRYRETWEKQHTYDTTRYSFDAIHSDYTNPEGVCGSVTFTNPSAADMDASALTQAVISAQDQSVATILASPELEALANTIAGADNAPPNQNTRWQVHAALQRLADTYSAGVVQAVESQGGISGMSDSQWHQFVNAMKETGWAYLPSYYNQLIRANDKVQSALNAMPDYSYDRVSAFASAAELTTYNDAMTRLEEYLQTPGDLIMANAQQVGGISLSRSVWEDLANQCLMKDVEAEKAKIAAVGSSATDSAYSHLQKCLSVVPRRGIFSFTESLMGGNLNHIVHIKSIGDTIISIGDGIIATNFLLRGATGNIVGSTIGAGSAMESMGGLLTTVAFALLSFGAIAAYYIPLIPYINGVVAFVKWLMLVIESIIAGPLFAAAHAFPEGHEVSGSAGAGYRLLLGLFFRPALTVLGFFLAIITAQPIADIVNVTYGNAVMGAESGSITGLTSLLAYVIVYVVIMTTVMHSVFALINWVPDNVLRWVGAASGAQGVGDQETSEAKGNVLAAFRGGSHIAAPKPRKPKDGNKDKNKGDKEKGDGNGGGNMTTQELRPK